MLADNRLALNAGWDEEMLRVELESLQEDGFDLDLVGFTDEEIEELLRDPEETNDGLTDEDAVPDEQETAVTVLGRRVAAGRRTDCCAVTRRKWMRFRRSSPAVLADMVFTDPPYNVDYEGKTAKKLTIGNDALGGKFYEFLRDARTNMLAVTKGAIYICMSSSELHTLYQAFTDARPIFISQMLNLSSPTHHENEIFTRHRDPPIDLFEQSPFFFDTAGKPIGTARHRPRHYRDEPNSGSSSEQRGEDSSRLRKTSGRCSG